MTFDKPRIEHLYNIHHKVKKQLDMICQDAGDMNVEEFMEVYYSLRKELLDFKYNQKAVSHET